MKRKLLLLGLLIIVGFIVIFNQRQSKIHSQTNNQPVDTLKIISTKPDPLDEATILPNQIIEITFNMSFDIGKLKVKLDPEVDYEITTSHKKPISQTILISFKKPLQLGSGYTLFLFPDPTSQEKLKMDKEYNFHFRTIGYQGI